MYYSISNHYLIQISPGVIEVQEVTFPHSGGQLVEFACSFDFNGLNMVL